MTAPQAGVRGQVYYDRLAVIKELAGKASRYTIADKLKISAAYVSCIAGENNISLRVPRERKVRKPKEGPPIKQGHRKAASQDELDADSELLRLNGYTVILPDPFRRGRS